MIWNNVQPKRNTYVHCAQHSQHHWSSKCPTLSHAACLHTQVIVFCQLLSLFPGNVAITRTADINKKTNVCLLNSETDVRTIGIDLAISSRRGSSIQFRLVPKLILIRYLNLPNLILMRNLNLILLLILNLKKNNTTS